MGVDNAEAERRLRGGEGGQSEVQEQRDPVSEIPEHDIVLVADGDAVADKGDEPVASLVAATQLSPLVPILQARLEQVYHLIILQPKLLQAHNI